MIKFNYKKTFKKLSLFTLFVSSLSLTACSANANQVKKHEVEKVQQSSLQIVKENIKDKKQNVISKKKNNNSHSHKKSKIMNEYANWKGTKYRYGGTTKSGIDCSAFVGKVFDGAFSVDLPRTTTELKLLGTPVDKNDLQVGDLVFFRKNKHVGVYIGDDQFVHSSSKNGVITSSLASGYYNDKYTQARRLM